MVRRHPHRAAVRKEQQPARGSAPPLALHPVEGTSDLAPPSPALVLALALALVLVLVLVPVPASRGAGDLGVPCVVCAVLDHIPVRTSIPVRARNIGAEGGE